MRGIYRFYKEGQLVSEHENLVTNDGRKIIQRYLAGLLPAFGDFIAVGTGASAPAATDTSLNFEFSRGSVVLKSVDVATGRITFKGALDTNTGGQIYEVGLFPTLANAASGEFGTKILTQFESNIETWSTFTSNTVNYRIGAESLQVNPAASQTATVTNSALSMNLSGYSSVDQFALAFFINDSNTATIYVRLKTDAANYYEYSFAPGTTVAYTVKNFTKTNFVATGAPDWSNINIIEIAVVAGSGGSTTVQLDGLCIIDKDTYMDYAMVSRALVSPSIPKALGEQLDVEYTLEIDV